MGSDNESDASMEGEVDMKASSSYWGKSKRDYYYTDYIDKDYPSKLSDKEEKAARIEQEEAVRIQKKLLSTLDNLNIEPTFDLDDCGDQDKDKDFDLIDYLEKQNQFIESQHSKGKSKRKRVTFESDGEDEDSSEGPGGDDDDNDDDDDDDNNDEEINETLKNTKKPNKNEDDSNSTRRPINIAIKKNRGLTPYKKKEYRNPRVKHKNKYRKAMVKRRRNVREAQIEYHRYSGEAHGIKTSTIKSIKLC